MSKNDNPSKMTYEASGVSIERGNQAVDWIKPLAQSTRRPEVVADVGGFAGAFRLGGEDLLAGADGVGSKLLLAKELGRFDTIGIDLVAMNVNDVLAAGGEPLFFLDYVALGYLDPARVRDLVAGVAAGCREAGAALLGGETAEMPDLYPEGDFDLSGFAVGVRRFRPMQPPQAGDVVLGLASSGFHANGFQLARRVVKMSGHRLDDRPSVLGGRTLGEVLLTPTRIYVAAIKDLWSQVGVKAMAHITGGGLPDNLPRTLNGLGALLEASQWPKPPEMDLIQSWGEIEDSEMAHAFNLGIGFTVTLSPSEVERCQSILSRHQIDSYPIGVVRQQPGVEIR
ncbi:phosphoribosylformylglycinamidine cyclo-ligase [Sulfobacillus harzensis]|uniref:Phosphoribosylformylglycinamidine cyclo-ligase n=1 Tax=Sulfobacillus harzensis TaxID=2729629 RepID=A0A7Y0Q1Y8_9FIRM|nr:phosphoribosylformylglycinamidine cyclo-ligase [Sulfobacillus harzensis]NMP22608.1 phosphoribosylformylglycinamidine cyclo-ligase [Sulfobacillus harzensis]